MPEYTHYVATSICSNSYNQILLIQKQSAHVSIITALLPIKFGEYSRSSTMVIMVGAESAPSHGKEDILEAMGIRVNKQTETAPCQEPQWLWG